jgi:hypothetical protein
MATEEKRVRIIGHSYRVGQDVPEEPGVRILNVISEDRDNFRDFTNYERDTARGKKLLLVGNGVMPIYFVSMIILVISFQIQEGLHHGVVLSQEHVTTRMTFAIIGYVTMNIAGALLISGYVKWLQYSQQNRSKLIGMIICQMIPMLTSSIMLFVFTREAGYIMNPSKASFPITNALIMSFLTIPLAVGFYNAVRTENINFTNFKQQKAAEKIALAFLVLAAALTGILVFTLFLVLTFFLLSEMFYSFFISILACMGIITDIFIFIRWRTM